MLDLKIGNIVSLSSHPYNYISKRAIISGEAQLIAPMMVVVELLKETSSNFDEHTGEEVLRKGSYQCKCLWYSQKSSQFEESWLHSSLLKVIEDAGSGELEQIAVGDEVSLKTLPLELGKKKSSLAFESDRSKSLDKISTTSLLSFVAPVMQVIQIMDAKKSESKESLFDGKTGIQRRFISGRNLKCKWFNSNLDKFSERIMPIESLQLIEKLNDDAFHKIERIIRKEQFLIGEVETIEKEKTILSNTILQPTETIYRSGKYYFKAFNFITNYYDEISLSSIFRFEESPEYLVGAAPKFEFIPGRRFSHDTLTKQIELFVKDALAHKSYLRIKYKNRNDIISIRTLDNYRVEQVPNSDDEQILYLTGYCNLRQGNRSFKVDRILSVEELRLKYFDRELEVNKPKLQKAKKVQKRRS